MKLLLLADARMIPLAGQSVQCVVTSPPYWGLRDYGVASQLGLEPTPEEYVSAMVAVFREVWRVLRDDGTVWLNLGDSFANSGSAPPRRDHSGGASLGTYGKQLYSAACQGPARTTPPGLKPKDLVGIPWRVAFALQSDGWYLRSDVIWSKPNPMPESVTDRPTKAHEYLFLLSKRERYFYDHEAIREDAIHSGRIVSYDGSQKNTGHENRRYPGAKPRDILVAPYRNRRSVWTIPTQPYKGAHFATFPEKLVEPCVLAGCPKGGIVLDPFGGSGTTAQVAVKHGRRGICMDLSRDYLALARKRTAAIQRRLI